MTNVVIPMAGIGSRFVKAGFSKPKPFIDVLGKSMIERVLENLYFPEARFILIGRNEHLQKERDLVQKITSELNAEFISIDRITEGSACTVLFARDIINNDAPLLIANSDQLIDLSMQNFINDCKSRDLDGSILTFKDLSKNPKWSFAKLNNSGIVTEVREKEPISEFATVGIYYFSMGCDFVNGAIDMIINNDRVNNEFYTCPVYNYLIRDKKEIGVFNINQEAMNGIGTPEDLSIFLNKTKKDV